MSDTAKDAEKIGAKLGEEMQLAAQRGVTAEESRAQRIGYVAAETGVSREAVESMLVARGVLGAGPKDAEKMGAKLGVDGGKWAWAYDEEGPFHDGGSSAESAALEGLDNSDVDGVYVGESKDVDIGRLIDEDGLIETMMCRACDDVGDVADDWLSAIKQADRDALKAAILPIVKAWVDERDPISFWRVVNVRYVARTEVPEAEQFDVDDAEAPSNG